MEKKLLNINYKSPNSKSVPFLKLWHVVWLPLRVKNKYLHKRVVALHGVNTANIQICWVKIKTLTRLYFFLDFFLINITLEWDPKEHTSNISALWSLFSIQSFLYHCWEFKCTLSKYLINLTLVIACVCIRPPSAGIF